MQRVYVQVFSFSFLRANESELLFPYATWYVAPNDCKSIAFGFAKEYLATNRNNEN